MRGICALSVVVWSCTLLLSGSAASSSVASQQTDLVYWEEELPKPTVESIENKEPSRRLFWHGRMHEDEQNAIIPQTALPQKTKFKPHPMRTNEWQLDLQMSPKEAYTLGINATTMLLDFAENGFCRLVNDSPLLVGKWKMHPSGITWKIPLQQANDTFALVLVCHADLILNPFGKRPRMVRGTIVKDDGRSKWFRPVVATFSGEGIGQDTADVSYKERGFGL
jgi:hypothetical protein